MDVDSGVKVFRGVDVAVVVAGTASCVFVNAASAVCAIYVLIAFGSSGATGVTMDGAHAMIRIRVMNQRKYFFPGDLIAFYMYLLGFYSTGGGGGRVSIVQVVGYCGSCTSGYHNNAIHPPVFSFPHTFDPEG